MRLTSEVLRFTPRQLGWGVLRQAAVTGPALIVAAKDTGVVLELDEVELPAAEEK